MSTIQVRVLVCVSSVFGFVCVLTLDFVYHTNLRRWPILCSIFRSTSINFGRVQLYYYGPNPFPH